MQENILDITVDGEHDLSTALLKATSALIRQYARSTRDIQQYSANRIKNGWKFSFIVHR